MRFKKILAGVLASAMTLTAGVLPDITPAMQSSMTVSAVNYNDEIEYGDLYYERVYEDMDGTYDSIRIVRCNKLAFTADIPSEIDDLPVTAIGESAFKGCSNLIGIKIPNSVTLIGYEAFLGCTNLTSIEIPNSITEIKYRVFFDCTSLTSIEIPDSVTSIEKEAFSNCTSLTNVVIPDSVTSIDIGAFSYCKSLISVVIPDSVTSVNSDAFSGTPLLENQTGVKYADKWVVDCDEDVTKAEIKSGTKGIANSAFAFCEILTSVVIPDSVTSIGFGAFWGCKDLKSIEIPDSVTQIGYNVFRDTPFLENQTGVKYANKWVIGCDKDVTKAEIKSGTKGIADSAFSWRESLKNVVIPDSVTSIGFGAFSDCTGLTSITIKNPECEIYNNERTICTGEHNGKYYFNGTIYGYKNSTAQAYAEKWGYKFESIGEPSVTTAPPTTTTTAIITTQAADTTAAIETTTVTTAANAGIAVPTGVTATKHGDINCDEGINISDVVAINLFILNQKEYPLEDTAIANADCVRDNVINASDSTILMNYVAEIIDISELGR